VKNTIVHINLPYAEIERRRDLLERAERLERPPRPPARVTFTSRFWLDAMRVDYARYRADVEYMVDCQARARKWILESIYDDSLPRDFACDRHSFYVVPLTFGCALAYGEYMPWIASHPVSTAADLVRLRCLDVNDNPVAVEERKLLRDIEELSSRYTFIYSDGRELPGRARLAPALFSTAPFCLATDLMGSEIYVRLKEDPPFVHELLDILVQKYVDRREFVISEYGGSREELHLVDDSCSVLSPDTYLQFQAPRILDLHKRYPGRLGIHIDGQSNHLIPIYANVLKVTRFFGFGPMVDKRLVAHALGGKCSLLGNIDPVLLHSGPRARIEEACRETIAAFEPCGGFTLLDGNNVAPGTPQDHLATMRKTAEQLSLRGGG
jgi:uroporphyrinogen-III decarboxylase